MRVLPDHLGRIAGVVDQDFLRSDEDVDGVAIGFDVKRAVGRELQQVQAGEVAGRIVEEHVLAARVQALMRAVFFEVCQRLTVVSYCMPGSPQCQVASEIL